MPDTPSIDNVSLAEVYDVSCDSWLGQTNGIWLISPGEGNGHALTLTHSGVLRSYCKAGRALEQARRVGKRLAGEASQARPLFELSAELRLQDAIVSRNDAAYARTPDGGKFVIMGGPSSGRPSTTVTKYLRPHAEDRRNHYPHRGADDNARNCCTYWSKRKPRHVVLMTEQRFAQWLTKVTVQASKAQMKADEYTAANWHVNWETLRVAHALGIRAVAEPFDVTARCARILHAGCLIHLIQNGSDLIDVEVERDGIVLARRANLVSLTMSHDLQGGILGSSLAYNELGVAVYEAWLSSRAQGQEAAEAEPCNNGSD